MSKIDKEKRTLKFMINLYCEKKHKLGIEDCSNCKELYDYAANRLDGCRYGENKTSCKSCIVHCFSNEKREEIKKIMRFSGPRIIFYRPYYYISYILKPKEFKSEN